VAQRVVEGAFGELTAVAVGDRDAGDHSTAK
jgi:hypothetical protein